MRYDPDYQSSGRKRRLQAVPIARLLNIVVNFSALVIYTGLIVYILRKNPKAALNRLCACIFVSFAVFSLGQMFLQNAASVAQARFWVNVSSVGWCTFPVFGLWFYICFADKGWWPRKFWIYAGSALMSIYFIYQQFAGNLIVDFIERPYGWAVGWSKSVVSLAFSLYYAFFVLLCAYLSLDILRNSNDLRKKKGAYISCVTMLIALPLGFLTDTVLPALETYTLPPMGNVMALVWAGGLAYVVERYGILTLTPIYVTSEILSTMGDSLMLVDMTGRIVFANQATTEMLGYSVREMYGRTLHSLFTGPGPQGLDEQSFISTLISHKKIKDINVLYVAKDGKTVPVLFSASLAERDEVPVGVVVTAHDMTSYMEIAENLRLSEERYRTLVENALVGIGIHQDNKTVYANPVLVEMLGYTADEVIGLPIAQIIAPEERDLVLTRAKRRQEGKDEPVIYEITLIRKDGAPLYALISNVVIDYNGTKATMFTISDITDTKARRELEMANRELEAFSYSVSHDLRAPLRAIHGFAEALIEDYGDRLDEVGMDYLNRVRRSAERMAQLIDGLLSLSRLSQRDLYVGMVDLSTLAREVIEELSQRQPDRSVEVKIADGLVAECDMDLVRIVLDNLLGNSWKFTVGKDQAVIEFGAIGQNGETVYFVRDNGVGFDMRYADKLFMPFQRLHGEEFEGTGIGLATVARIIYRHGGRIWAEGVPGAGATFFFTLSEPGRESNGRKKNSA